MAGVTSGISCCQSLGGQGSSQLDKSHLWNASGVKCSNPCTQRQPDVLPLCLQSKILRFFYSFVPGCSSAGWTEQLPDTPVEESTPASESTEKIKKRYRKKKNKLEETFPAYLQVKLVICSSYCKSI